MSDEDAGVGLLVRVYRRQARSKQGGRGRDRQGGRDAKFGRDAEFDSEQRIKADMEAEARAKAAAEQAIAALRTRLGTVKEELAALDGQLTECLTRAADPLTDRLKQAASHFGQLTDDDPDPPEAMQRAKEIGATLTLLSNQARQITNKIREPVFSAAIGWANGSDTYKRFPAVKQEVGTVHQALAAEKGIDTGALGTAIAAIEGWHAVETQGLVARGLLRTAWSTAKPVVEQVLDRVSTAAGRPGRGPAAALAAPIDDIAAADMPAEASDPARHQALMATIQDLVAWAPAASQAIAGFAYFDQVLADGKQAYTVAPMKGQAPPRIDRNTVVTGMLEAAVLQVPFNQPTFQTAVNEVILFPGPWQIPMQRANMQAAAQAALAQAANGTAALSTFLQNSWAMAAGAANALAAQMYGAYPGAQGVLAASGLTQATWTLLSGYIPTVFADLATAFAAIVATGNTDAAVARLCTNRLARRALTAANGAFVLAQGEAVLQGARGYPSVNYNTGAVTAGGSVNLAWAQWMPVRFAAENYWGAVHFHFPGKSVAAVPTMAHMKEYETQVVGGNGPLNYCTGTGLATTCLAPVQATGFTA